MAPIMPSICFFFESLRKLLLLQESLDERLPERPGTPSAWPLAWRQVNPCPNPPPALADQLTLAN